MGFWIGLTVFPTWQVAVETAQVVAGIVKYPSDNPFYIYHTKLWTVVHQIYAVLLLAGVSERTLSEVGSGVRGMVSLQALAMFVYAFSGDAAYAIGSAFVICFSGATNFGAVYPVWLMGTSNTYGVIGLSMLVLAAGSIGSGRSRSGGFLLGATPAVHPALGIWLGIILAICVATGIRKVTAELRPALPWFIAGCGFTVASLTLHMVFTYDVPVIDKVLLAPYLSAFEAAWDGHRVPVNLGHPGVLLNVGALALALTWLLAFSQDLPRASLFLLRFTIASAGLAIACVFLSWIPAERQPALLVVLMPSRIVNINVMTFAALLLGLLGAYRERWSSQPIAWLLFGGLLLADRSQLWATLRNQGRSVSELGLPVLRVMTIASVALVLYVYVLKWIKRSGRDDGRTGTVGHPKILATTRIVRAVLLVVSILYLVPAMVPDVPRLLAWRFRDRLHDPVLGTAAAGSGLLLTGGDLHLIQLRTRRPVLLDGGGLDGLAYSAEGGPAMARIMLDVYGVDLFRPPADRGSGTIPRGTNRRVWEGYSPRKWQEIRRAYNVTEVLTEAGWVLDLPLVTRTDDLLLYRIPE